MLKSEGHEKTENFFATSTVGVLGVVNEIQERKIRRMELELEDSK